MKNTKPISLMLGMLLLTRGGLLMAEENVPDVTMPEVLVRGAQDKKNRSYNPSQISLPKYTGTLVETPQSITLVPQKVMKDQGVTTLREALRNVSGISLSAGEGGFQGDNLTIRGFASRSDFFLDGMRDFGSYFRDPFNTEQVEVLKGPASIMFGRGSTGGIVNQQSKKPDLKGFVAGTLSLGTDLTRRLTVDVNQALPFLNDTTAFRINLMGTESDVAERDVAHNRRYGIAPSISFGVGTSTRTDISFLHQSEDNKPDYGLPFLFSRPAPVDRTNYYGFKNGNFLKTDAEVLTAKVEHDFNEHFTLRNQLRYGHYDRDVRISEARVPAATALGTPASAISVDRNQITAKSTESALLNDLSLTSKFSTGIIKHTVVSGFEASRETSTPTRTSYAGVPTTGLVNPDPNQAFVGTPTVTSIVKAKAATVALYLMDTMKIGKKWEVQGGIRWDHVDSDYDQTVAPAASFNRTDDAFSWRGSLLFKPIPKGSAYFSYGTSFNPSIEGLSLAANNANLSPEKNRTFEIGTKWDLFKDRLGFSGAIFRNEKTNARTVDPTNPLLNVLTGKQKVDGFEFAASGNPTKKWKIISSYTFLDSEILDSNRAGEEGNKLQNTPTHTFNIWSTYELPLNFEVGAGLKFVSSRNVGISAEANTGLIKQVPSYVTADAMAKYKINSKIDVQLNAYNLTNKLYFDGLHPNHIIPGPGRTFLLSSNFKF